MAKNKKWLFTFQRLKKDATLFKIEKINLIIFRNIIATVRNAKRSPLMVLSIWIIYLAT